MCSELYETLRQPPIAEPLALATRPAWSFYTSPLYFVQKDAGRQVRLVKGEVILYLGIALRLSADGSGVQTRGPSMVRAWLLNGEVVFDRPLPRSYNAGVQDNVMDHLVSVG